MILYFSATGNSKRVAERILEAMPNERLVSITTANINEEYKYKLKDGEMLGIITPTYCFQLPSIVDEFLNKLVIKGVPSYTYLVSTYGVTPGQTAFYVRKILRKSRIKLNGAFTVRYPDTFTPVFDLSNQATIYSKLSESEKQISQLIENIKNNVTGVHQHPKTPLLLGPINRTSYEVIRSTKPFNVDSELCTKCGLCVAKCPSKAITMTDKGPKWTKDKCTLCLGCLHRCPSNAISFGKNTRKHGQYQNLYTKV